MARPMISLIAFLSLVFVACAAGTGSDESSTSTAPTASTVATTTPTTTPATTTPAAETTSTTTTTPAVATTSEVEAGQPITLNPDGTYAIDWGALAGPAYFAPPAAGSADPFFHVHNDPASDGFFFSVEAYTSGYGTAWTGELGDFVIDCSPAGTGICVHFDPDGPGPLPDLGSDFLVTGDVSIEQADGDGFVATFSNVGFSDGTTIPGPFTVNG